MDAEPAAKRPCLKQTTLFGQVVVTDVDIYKKPTNDYERFVNEFVRCERRARGSYTCTEQNRASYKRAADQAWRTASAAEKRKLIDREDETPSTSKASSSSQSKVADYGFRQLGTDDVSVAASSSRLSIATSQFGSPLSRTVASQPVSVCGRRSDPSPAAALVKQEVSTFLAAVAPTLLSADLLTDDVVANTLFMEALGAASQGYVTYTGVLAEYKILMEG